MNEATIRDDLAALYRDVGRLGLNQASAGNVSVRLENGDMLITPSGARADSVTAERLVAMSLDGAARGPLHPSTEWQMHAEIYRTFPQAGTVVHTHSDAATALSCLGERLPPFHYMLAEFGGTDVRCAPYATFGTATLAAAAVDALAGRTACLLENHGAICFGPDMHSALLTAVRLESLCRQYMLARTAGRPRLLTQAQMEDARIRYTDYGQQPADGQPADQEPRR